MERSGFGSRVPKYQHRFCNTGFGTLEFSPAETAIICELLVRGPQTPGELRSRAARMAEVHDVTEIEAALDNLATRNDGPFVVRLAREPGRRDSRYAHLFSGEPELPIATESEEPVAEVSRAPSDRGRIDRLEAVVQELQRELEALKARLP